MSHYHDRAADALEDFRCRTAQQDMPKGMMALSMATENDGPDVFVLHRIEHRRDNLAKPRDEFVIGVVAQDLVVLFHVLLRFFPRVFFHHQVVTPDFAINGAGWIADDVHYDQPGAEQFSQRASIVQSVR